MGIFNSFKLLYSSFKHFLSILNIFAFVSYFGFIQIIKFNSWIGKFIKSFQNIYSLQDSSFTFNSIDEFLKKLHPKLYKMSQTSFKEALNEQNFNIRLSNELSSVATLVNYNQSTKISGFVGLVSLAGTTGDLWSIKDGNRLVPERLIKQNESIVKLRLNTKVISISPNLDNKNLIEYEYKNEIYQKNYDYVIIAFPLTKQTIGNLNINYPNVEDYSQYELQLTKTYMIEARRINLFNVPNDKRIELYSCDETNPIRNIAVQYPCDYDKKKDKDLWLKEDEPKLYKIFSPVDVSSTEFNKIFNNDFKVIKEENWLAYPKYNQDGTSKFPNIIIDSNERSRVLYLNSIEWSSSCMEICCIGARNIALLIAKKEQNMRKVLENNQKYSPSEFQKFIKKVKEILIDSWLNTF